MEGKSFRCVSYFAVLTILGAADVALQYFCGGIVLRHSVWMVLALSVVKGLTWGTLLAGIGFLICRRATVASILLFALPAFVVLLESISWFTFHMGLGGEWFTLVVTSSRSEMLEFFKSIPCFTWLGFAAALAVTAGLSVAIRRMFRDLGQVKFLTRLCASLVCLLLFALGKAAFPMGWDCAYPRFIPSTVANILQYRSIRQCSSEKLPYEFSPVREDAELTAIFVIGESVCRRNWSLFGYGRKTTPCVDALPDGNKVAFSNVRTPYPQTAVALRYLLTDADLGHDEISFSFPAVLKHCGFTTAFISNQGHWYGIEGYESMLFALCDRQVYIADLNLPKPVYDDAVLPVVDEVLAGAGRQAIFVHLEGSHMPLDIRCPKGREVFDESTLTPDDAKLPAEVRRTLNGYDNSIAFTDQILGELIAKLSALNRPTLLFYVSDHGESPRSGGWRNLQDRDCWEVPMFVWFSDQYVQAYPRVVSALRDSASKSLQLDTLLYGLIELTGLTGTYPPARSFLCD